MLSDHRRFGRFSPALLAALFSALFYMGSEITMKMFGNISTLMTVGVNVVGGIILLSIYISKKGSLKCIWHHLFMIILAAVIGFGGGYLFLYKGIDALGSNQTSFLEQSEVLFMVVLSLVILKEKIKKKDILGGIILLGGILVLVYSKVSMTIDLIYPIIAGLCFAIGTIMIAKILKKYEILFITGLQMFFGGISLIPFLVVSEYHINVTTLLPMIILGVIISLSRLFYNKGVRENGACKTALVYSTKSLMIIGLCGLLTWLVPSLKFSMPTDIKLFLFGGLAVIIGILILHYEKPDQDLKID